LSKATSNTLILGIGQMRYNVYQHWDPLKVCIVGRSYRPEFYSFIKNDRVRVVMERIARETEEDFQTLISLLESFGVKVLRPQVSDNYKDYIDHMGKIKPPPMTPRDYSIMLGNDFYFYAAEPLSLTQREWPALQGASWPSPPKTKEELLSLPDFIKRELESFLNIKLDNLSTHPGKHFNALTLTLSNKFTWESVLDHISEHANVYNHVPWYLNKFNSACSSRIGKDIYLGTYTYGQDLTEEISELQRDLPQYRWHRVDTGGHSDGTYCPVKPGLIVSLMDVPTYAETFPGWEVVYLPGQSWNAVKPFLELKNKNYGKWWVPGEELNDDFTEFVENWLGHWVGYVEETVFDVNMLVIDEHNVVCNNYNKKVFEAFERHGVTPHIINFRHRYFWDGGLHCITSDVHREGTMKDYFPERNSK
jgi:hypothetical protein